MKLRYFITFCLFIFGLTQTDLFGQRLTYSNDACDSVQIDFGLIDIHNNSYEIRDVQVVVGNNIYPALNKSRVGFVKVIIPKTLIIQHTDSLVINVFHKSDKSKDLSKLVKTRDICVGFCHPPVIQMKNPLINKYEGGGTRTITSDEIEKGAY